MLHVVGGLNFAANAIGRVIFAPIALLPGWVSATLVAVGTGFLMLLTFKYTSNQRAIKRVRNDIKADLLALSLFKDSVAVSLRAQRRILISAGKLLSLAFVPMLVMIVPMSLLLGQLALWYQARPLAVGEETVVTLRLSGESRSAWPDVRLEATGAIEPAVGPVRVESQRRLCWRIRAVANGSHRLTFVVAGQLIHKELAISDGFLRTSPVRPGWNWVDSLLYPWESPFPPESPVESIDIEYPARSSWTCGSRTWLAYWFVVSMLTAVVSRGILGVNL